MKKVMLVALPLVFATIGCSLPGEKAHWGCTVILHKPSSVDTEIPVLVSPGSSGATAQAVGGSAGPIVSGDFSHGIMAAPLPAAPSRQSAVLGPCDPPPYIPGQPRLTADQWLAITKQAQAKPLPQQE